VVLDTNVIVSGMNFPGNERMVLELALRGRFQLFLSWFIQGEVSGVLTRKFGWDQERAIRAISSLQNAATIFEPPRLAEVIADGHADNRVLECLVAASADHLVTGDRRHLLPLGEHQGASIVNAPRFLSMLN
jgi:putative PIN family toxin of toxin-antitoxin system